MKRRDFLLAASGVAGGTAVSASAVAQETTTSAGGNQTGGNQTGGNQSGGNGTAGNGTGGNQSGGNQTGGNQSSGGGGGGGQTHEISVVSNKFEPAEKTIAPGDTVKWVFEDPGHNVKAESGEWGTKGGEMDPVPKGSTFTHTFDSTGEHPYYCGPHKSLGMEGTITVQEGGASSGGGAEAEVNPEEMGVPFQAHYVGIATILMIIVTLVYTFFFLKYGESAHSNGGN